MTNSSRQPWTLRHVRRRVARHPEHRILVSYTTGQGYLDVRVEGALMAVRVVVPDRLLAVYRRAVESADDVVRLDRLIGALGPDWPAREARPKGTDEVTPDANPGDTAHGGDGASGEVAPQDSSAPGGQKGDDRDDSLSQSTGSPTGEDDRSGNTAAEPGPGASPGAETGSSPGRAAGFPEASERDGDAAPQGAGDRPQLAKSGGESGRHPGELTSSESASSSGDTPGASSAASQAGPGAKASAAEHGPDSRRHDDVGADGTAAAQSTTTRDSWASRGGDNSEPPTATHQGSEDEASLPATSDEESSGTGSSPSRDDGLDPVQRAALELERELRDRSNREQRQARMWLRRNARVCRLIAEGAKGGVVIDRLLNLLDKHIDRFDLREAIEAFRSAVQEARERAEAAANGVGVVPSLRNRSEYGGQNADLLAAQAAAKGLDRRLTRRIQKAIERLVEREVGPLGDATPRIDGGRLVRELCGRSVRLSRARRAEHEPRIVVVAVDWSGSCSSSCEELLAAAVAAARGDQRIAVVCHSNGHPDAWFGTPAREFPIVPDYGGGHAGISLWWASLAQRAALLVALGDHDAEVDYRAFVEAGADVLWLHNYRARHGVRLPERKLLSQVEHWTAPLTLIQGVSAGPGILEGLHLARTGLPSR